MIKKLIVYSLAVTLFNSKCSNKPSEKYFEEKIYNEIAQSIINDDASTFDMLTTDESVDLETTSYKGNSLLVIALFNERYEMFKRLIELGANPNFINPLTKESVLMKSVRSFGSQFEWNYDLRYMKLLLENGADPNYAISQEIIVDTNKLRTSVLPTSPLINASNENLEMVQLLLEYGADFSITTSQPKKSAFGTSLDFGKIEIARYYLERFEIDLHEPLKIVTNVDGNVKYYYVQDLITNKFTLAKILNNEAELNELLGKNPLLEKANEERWAFILELEELGVDFKNHDYN